MGTILPAPRNLTPVEWDQVLSNFNPDSKHYKALEIVKQKGNIPQRANELFDKDLVNQEGQDFINSKLRERNIPFRLARIGPHTYKDSRHVRALAVVPWTS